MTKQVKIQNGQPADLARLQELYVKNRSTLLDPFGVWACSIEVRAQHKQISQSPTLNKASHSSIVAL